MKAAASGVNTAGNALIIRTKPLVLGAVVTTKPEIRRTLINSSFNPQDFTLRWGGLAAGRREGAGSPVRLAGWMVDRPRCSGQILSRSVVDDIRPAAAAMAIVGERDGAAKRLLHTQSVAGIPDRGRGGNNKEEQRNESGPKFINGRQAGR